MYQVFGLAYLFLRKGLGIDNALDQVGSEILYVVSDVNGISCLSFGPVYSALVLFGLHATIAICEEAAISLHLIWAHFKITSRINSTSRYLIFENNK